MTKPTGAQSLLPAPMVSVVMPTYQRPDDIGASIRSLLHGTWEDFELLVRDDGSGDDGTEVAVRRAATGDKRVRYHRNNQRLGMPENLNQGIRESRGQYIAVCHDHDLYDPTFLSTMVGTLERHPSAVFVHCAIEMANGQGESIALVGDWPEIVSGEEWLRIMLRNLSCPVCALTVVPRWVHERYGLYDESYGFISDVEMWMRLSCVGNVAYVVTPLIKVRNRDTRALTGWKQLQISWNLARIHRRYIAKAYPTTGQRVISYVELTRNCLSRFVRQSLAAALLGRRSRNKGDP